jgi:hypothetical protein
MLIGNNYGLRANLVVWSVGYLGILIVLCKASWPNVRKSHGFLLLPRPVTCGSCESHGSIIVWVAFLETFSTVSNFDLHRGIENVLQTFLRFVNNLVVCLHSNHSWSLRWMWRKKLCFNRLCSSHPCWMSQVIWTKLLWFLSQIGSQ